MIKITIVTPTYNRSHLLPRAWNSLRTQTIDFEWIVVDDGSTDDTANIMELLADPRIRYLRHSANRGVGAARNTGVKHARGKYVVLLDSDDELYPAALTDMAKTLDGTSRDIGVASFQCIELSTGLVRHQLPGGIVLGEYEVVCRNALCSDTILVYRREVFDAFLLEEDLKGCENVFVYSVATKYQFLVVDRPGSIVHRQDDNLSGIHSAIARSGDMAQSFERIVENHRELLSAHPRVRNWYLLKALYRYGVAGKRKDAVRLFRSLLESEKGVDRLQACGFAAIAMTGAAPGIEALRLSLLNWKSGGARR